MSGVGGQALSDRARLMPCHPFFQDRDARTVDAECLAVDEEVSAVLMSAMEEEEVWNGTVCAWCMLHPLSPQVPSPARLTCCDDDVGDDCHDDDAGGDDGDGGGGQDHGVGCDLRW